MTRHVTNGNIFEDLGFNKVEAANLKVRAVLMHKITDYINSHNLKQKDAAERLSVTQPRISDIMNGKIGKFTVDGLLEMLTRVGFEIDTSPKKKQVLFAIIEGGKKTPKNKASDLALQT